MRKTFFLSLFALAATWALSAQQQPQKLEISLQQALEIALDENPTIKVADLEVARQQYVRRETIGGHLPQLSVDGTWNHTVKQQAMASGVSFGSDNTVTGVANLTVPLFAPGVYATLKLNDEQMRAAVEAARGSRITMVNEVRKSYYNILFNQRSLDVLRASEANISQTVDETKVKFDTGLASEYDYITASVKLSNLQPNILNAQNGIEVAKKMLKMYMGLPLDMDIELRGDLDEMAAVVKPADLLYIDDVSANSDLRAMDAQIGIMDRTLKVTRTQRMPTLAAFGNYTLYGSKLNSFSFDPSVPVPAAEWKWQRPAAAGLQLSIPIFSGLTKVNKERQLKNQLSQLRLQRDYKEESVNVELDNARSALLTAQAKMKANEITVAQAQKGYDISKARYDGGMGTILELNTAELDLTQARLNFTQSEYDYLAAVADYEKVIGRDYQTN